MHTLQSFFLETVEDAAMTTQRAAMQAARNQEVRRALRALRRALPRFRWDAREAPGGVEGIVLISCSVGHTDLYGVVDHGILSVGNVFSWQNHWQKSIIHTEENVNIWFAGFYYLPKET